MEIPERWLVCWKFTVPFTHNPLIKVIVKLHLAKVSGMLSIFLLDLWGAFIQTLSLKTLYSLALRMSYPLNFNYIFLTDWPLLLNILTDSVSSARSVNSELPFSAKHCSQSTTGSIHGLKYHLPSPLSETQIWWFTSLSQISTSVSASTSNQYVQNHHHHHLLLIKIQIRLMYQRNSKIYCFNQEKVYLSLT